MTFSVIIPVYNRASTLKSAIESVLSQTFSDYEIIVVDDGSDKVVKKALKPYMGRVKYIKLNNNFGVSHARNIGIKAARGKYIAFLDSDDLWLPDKLQMQFDMFQQSDLPVIHTNEFWFRGDRFINQGKRHKRYGGKIFDKVLDFCRISPSSVAIRKDVFKVCDLFDEKMRVCEDYDLWLRICEKYEVGYLPEKLIIKRAITDDQLSDSIKHIEFIRLVALARFVQCKKLSSENKLSAIKEINRKAGIVMAGINNF